MIRVAVTVIFLLFVSSGFCQIRMAKLVVERSQKFVIEKSDILVVDTLVMLDSSSIILNLAKKDNFIHAKEVVIGEHCSIIGQGKNGEPGVSGELGIHANPPCRRGLPGGNATEGGVGQNGTNLSLYFGGMKINGSLIINLNGGDGGDGANGGPGGDGGSGVRVCIAGDGGKGGNGSNGGDGGRGGDLNLNCKNCEDLHLLASHHKLIVKNFGGLGGIGGDGGRGGRAGLGPAGDGKNGLKGFRGAHAAQGKDGVANLSRNY